MTVLILSLILVIVILLYLLVKPMINRKFGTQEKVVLFNDLTEIEGKIVRAAVNMAQSNKTMMPFSDEESLYKELAVLKNKLKGKNNTGNYAYFNFPRAWLLLGLLRYGVAKTNSKLIELIKQQAGKLTDETGNLKFNFDKIDQALFGLLFIELHRETKDPKYAQAADHIYRFAQRFKTKDGLYRYRLDVNALFIDTLGMIVPFLCAYAEFKEEPAFRDEAKHQLDAYLDFTRTGSGTYPNFPPHAYDRDNEISLGSVNWGRGLGWFMIGLGFLTSIPNQNDTYKTLFGNYWDKLEHLAIDGFWPQFLGHTNESDIDTSATLLFYFSKMLVYGKYDWRIEQALNHSINPAGYILNNSGDTIYINRYAKTKGKSELGQGLLLCLLAKKEL